MDEHTLKTINNYLVLKYGTHFDGRPRWRLISNKGLTEKRYGKFAKFDEHGNFLGEFEGVMEVEKYNYIPEHIYILEQLYFADRLPFELAVINANKNGTYEIRWPFMNNDLEYLEPTIEGCDFIITAVHMTQDRKVKSEADKQKRFINWLMANLEDAEYAFNGQPMSAPSKQDSWEKTSGRNDEETLSRDAQSSGERSGPS